MRVRNIHVPANAKEDTLSLDNFVLNFTVIDKVGYSQIIPAEYEADVREWIANVEAHTQATVGGAVRPYAAIVGDDDVPQPARPMRPLELAIKAYAELDKQDRVRFGAHYRIGDVSQAEDALAAVEQELAQVLAKVGKDSLEEPVRAVTTDYAQSGVAVALLREKKATKPDTVAKHLKAAGLPEATPEQIEQLLKLVA